MSLSVSIHLTYFCVVGSCRKWSRKLVRLLTSSLYGTFLPKPEVSEMC